MLTPITSGIFAYADGSEVGLIADHDRVAENSELARLHPGWLKPVAGTFRNRERIISALEDNEVYRPPRIQSPMVKVADLPEEPRQAESWWLPKRSATTVLDPHGHPLDTYPRIDAIAQAALGDCVCGPRLMGLRL